MSLAVFAAVVFSAFFQASWNFVAKRSRSDKIALFAVGWFFIGLMLLPFAFLSADISAISARGWSLMFASGFIQAFYLCFLGWAYSLGEISVVFPVARGMGVFFTAIFSLALGLQTLSLAGGTGIALVVCGALFIGAREFLLKARRDAFFVALCVALCVGTYSVVDSMGAREVPLFLYLCSMNLLSPILASPFLFRRFRPQMRNVVRSHKLEAVWVGIAGMVAYGIVLWAYRRAETAYVSCLREISIVFAAALGLVFLRESLHWRKAAGIALIVAGVVCIKFA